MENDIDFEKLSDDEVEAIARGGDVWVVEGALIELYRRAPPRALPLAKTFLEGDDEFFAATSLSLVFGSQPEIALAFMRAKIATCGIPVLRAIVQCLATQPDLPRAGIEDLLGQVAARARAVAGEPAGYDLAELFFAKYPDLGRRS